MGLVFELVKKLEWRLYLERNPPESDPRFSIKLSGGLGWVGVGNVGEGEGDGMDAWILRKPS